MRLSFRVRVSLKKCITIKNSSDYVKVINTVERRLMIFSKNKLNKFVFFFLLFNLNVCYSGENFNYLELLRKHNKLLLELSINSLQKNISGDADSEGYYVAVINSLAYTLEDDGLDFIEQWILSGEESYLPYLLKGVYFANKGWRARGKSYSRQTPKEGRFNNEVHNYLNRYCSHMFCHNFSRRFVI